MVLTTPASSAQDPKPITPGSRTGPYFPKSAPTASKRPSASRDSTSGRATSTAPSETPRVPTRPSVPRKSVPGRRSSTVPENQEPVPQAPPPLEQPKPLIPRKTLPWLRRSTLKPIKPGQDASDASPTAAVSSTQAPTDAIPSTANGSAEDTSSTAHEASTSASRAVPTTDQTPNNPVSRDSTQPNPTSPPSKQDHPHQNPKDNIEAPASPPSTNTRSANDHSLSQAPPPPSRNHGNDPGNAPPAVPPVHDRLSDPEHPGTLPVRTLASAKTLDQPPQGAVAEPREPAPRPGPPKIALESAAKSAQPRGIRALAPSEEAQAPGQVPVEFTREAGRETTQKEGEGFGATRTRQGEKSGSAKEFEGVAERAVPRIEGEAAELSDEDGVVGEVLKPEGIGYWKPRRVRSPVSFWTEMTQAQKGVEKEGEKVAEPLEDVVEGSEHALVPPKDIGYWKPQRVRDPPSFWAAIGKGLKETEHVVEKVAEPLEDIVEGVEHAPVDPAKISYWKPRRVRSPMSFWTETTQALKAVEKVAGKVTEPLEDIVEGIEHALVEPAKIGYWQPKKVADPASYISKVLEPIQNLPHDFGHAHKVQSQSEDSFSEYSGTVSNYHYRTSSCGTYDSSRKSLSSGSRRPDFVPIATLPVSRLWNARCQRGSQYSTADDIRQASKQLDHAFRGLNVLMEEAMAVAQQAARSGHPDEVALVFNNAKAALRQTTNIREVALGRLSDNKGDTSRSLRAHVQDYGSRDRSIGATPPHLYDHASLDDEFVPGKPMRRHARPRLDDPVQIDHSALHAALRNLAPEPQKSSQPLVPAAAPAPTTNDDARTETDDSTSNHGWNDEMVDPWTHDSKQDLTHPRRHHISLREHQGFSLGRHHRRQPIAREWGIGRKRITATIACANTVFIGLIAGIYAGEVPKIQYQIADTNHLVVWGNVCLFAGVALTTLLFWPLPLLHGRKPYTLAAFAMMLPLQFPQALAITTYSDPHSLLARWGLLLPRALTGLAMGFANINFLPTLLDVFGASLMSDKPHQEIVVKDDVRRQGGGIGLWLGIWSWCYMGSLSVGFCIGACIISALDPAWGFYLVIILLAFFLFVNVVAPETRPSPYRRSLINFFDGNDKIKRRVARGEVKLHIHNTGPKWWWEEVWAGVVLTKRMVLQPGMAVMTWYAAWIYAQVLFVVILLGALLSRDYTWRASSVGLAALSLAIGALLAVPSTHAGLFSRSRSTPTRTDSMTFKHPTYVWTSHMARRCIFTLTLPLAGLAYTLASPGPGMHWVVPVVFVGLVGFLSNLAVSECIGIVMETFDTSDLQPGSNSKHRNKSLPEPTARRRTNYSSFPRVVAGLMATQSLGFALAAAATAVGGGLTRAVGAQISTAIVAGILLVLTVLLLIVLVRWKRVQVIPDGVLAVLESRRLTLATGAAGGNRGDGDREVAPNAEAEAEAEAEATGTGQDWRPVIIGNPSGKLRRMNGFELGRWTRWSEIRRLNKLDT